MSVAEISEINSFLKEFRKIMYIPGKFRFLNRTYNGITDLGLTLPQAKEEIKNLKYHNYDLGPSLDRIGDNTNIWEFGKLIDNHLVYIKLKIHPEAGCVCLSFKKSDGPFTLPYKNW